MSIVECARTGMAWSNLVTGDCLLLMIRAGYSEPGAPSPGAVPGFASARISLASNAATETAQ